MNGVLFLSIFTQPCLQSAAFLLLQAVEAQAAAAVMNVDALVAKPGAAPVQENQFYVGV